MTLPDIPHDKAMHVIACALIGTVGAHVASLLGFPAWAGALVSALAVGGAYEVWQVKTGRGHGSWNDMAANIAGGAVVALATLA